MPFTNNTHKSMITAFTDASKEMLKNPYYSYSNLKATIVDYFNINIQMSTLDEGAKIAYDYIGKNCPLRFNYIHEFFLYGLEKIQLSLDNGENGLESGDISGDVIILPNTIQPYAGDYFIINHMIKKFLFQIISVERDTLEDGANIWKASYRLERVLDEEQTNNLLDCLADEYEFDVTTVGTSFKSIVKKTDADLVKILEEVNNTLRKYYKSLFYSDKVQTFIYPYDSIQNSYIYDSYLIEFIIKNEIMKSDNEYTYVEHKLPIPASFSVDYAETFYRALETRDLEALRDYKYIGIGKYIDNNLSIFSTRPYNYFSVDYNLYNQMYHTLDERMKKKEEEIKENITQTGGVNYTRPVNVKQTTTHGDIICNLVTETVNNTFNPLINEPVIPDHIGNNLPPLLILKSEVIDSILNNELYDVGVNQQYNILIQYFNGNNIDADTISTLENIVYSNYNNNLYYLIPMIIYCVEQNIKRLMA